MEHPMTTPARPGSIIFLTVLAFLTLPLPAFAQSFYVDRAFGSDANSCAAPGAQACFTVQGAYNKCPRYGTCAIKIADGVYTEQINTYYQHAVDIRGNCADPSKVVLQTNAPTTVFIAQDTVISIIGCVTMTSTVPGAAAIASRQ